MDFIQGKQMLIGVPSATICEVLILSFLAGCLLELHSQPSTARCFAGDPTYNIKSMSTPVATGTLLRLLAWILALLGARTLLKALGLTTSSKKLLGAPGIATRSKNATKDF